LEAEVFSLARALITEEDKLDAVSLIDIGARSTTINIIDKGVLKVSHSFDTSGSDFTSVIAKSLGLEYTEAERLKKEHGLLSEKNGTEQAMSPLIDLILQEIKKIFTSFIQSEKKEIKKVVVAGASANMPGMIDYFSKNLQKPVSVANPFGTIFYPPILEDDLKNLGPSYAIAVGASLRGLEEI
jgi:type IV pilus assembly protein PilM